MRQEIPGHAYRTRSSCFLRAPLPSSYLAFASRRRACVERFNNLSQDDPQIFSHLSYSAFGSSALARTVLFQGDVRSFLDFEPRFKTIHRVRVNSIPTLTLLCSNSQSNSLRFNQIQVSIIAAFRAERISQTKSVPRHGFESRLHGIPFVSTVLSHLIRNLYPSVSCTEKVFHWRLSSPALGWIFESISFSKKIERRFQ